MNADLFAEVADSWWYYSVELQPGRVTKGICPPQLPMLPRMIARDLDMTGMDCLDVGAMEGLMSAMMRRKGAARVLALDAMPHCARKMEAVKAAYEVEFEFRSVGLMYDLARKVPDAGFDLINFSGIGYHVFSPMHCLAGLRPLLKKNGLMIFGTNVTKRDGHSLEFNYRGRLQQEANTFWYHSIPMMEELARYFLLEPIDALYYPHTAINPASYVADRDLGYLVIICRAVEETDATDEWTRRSHLQSWEYQGLCDSRRMAAQPVSTITYSSSRIPALQSGVVDLLSLAARPDHIVSSVSDLRDSHTLMLDHQA